MKDGQHACSNSETHCGILQLDAMFMTYYKEMDWEFDKNVATFCRDYQRTHFSTGTHVSNYSRSLNVANAISTKRCLTSYRNVLTPISLWDEFVRLKPTHVRAVRDASNILRWPSDRGTATAAAKTTLTTRFQMVEIGKD